MTGGAEMMKIVRIRGPFSCLLALLSAANALPQLRQEREPAWGRSTEGAAARKLSLPGLPNLGQVTEMLYRGGQPTEEGYRELKKLGIQIIVNFRNEKENIEAERREVEALGMRYVSIPWSGWHKPTNHQVARFLTLLRANREKKIFAHCHHGSERTGVMVAAFRMAMQDWTPQQVLEEMKEFHFHHFWFRHLRSYVEDFPRQFEADTNFRALQPAARTLPQ
jgi:protein tyrosine/serine phosphatase